MLKWLFASVAYGFLLYKLLTFEQYEELFEKLKLIDFQRFMWLVVVILLLPVNLFAETQKWRFLIRKIEKINFWQALKAVLAGFATGFLTPNRIGELVGRVLYLSLQNRRKGVITSIISGFTMTLVILFVGIPSLAFYLYKTDIVLINSKLTYFSAIALFVFFSLIVYFYLPKIGKKISFFSHLQKFNANDLLSVLCISLSRYAVFCLQFYCMLRFFAVEINLINSFTSICTNYLLITFTPSFAFSEAAVRSSYAALIFSAFSVESLSVIFAGISIWLINTIIPVLFGIVFAVRKK